ncbi:MAG: hypothetical protein K0R65_2540 [Crocinitomicaceae bacterium]|jgi:lysophospholipase L1-like esterase|nr:hypothetical protein [Crocinitomicaceae bacterium]
MPKLVYILPVLVLLVAFGIPDNDLISEQESRIYNRSAALDSLVYKLKHKQELTILHIGDSHIEMRAFPEGIRESFQNEGISTDKGWFLPAGIFHELYDAGFEVTRQSEPFRTENARTINPEISLGLTGRTFALENDENRICISSKTALTELEILHDTRDDLQIKVSGRKGKRATVELQEISPGYTVTKIILPASCSKFELRFSKKKADRVQFYGFRVKTAIVHYSNFGLSGGKFEHLCLARDLQKQAAALRPDLVIVTLGTNDSYQTSLDTTAFKAKLQFLVREIRLASANAEFVFMTAPDTKYKGNKPVHQPFVNRSIKAFCDEFHFAYWDWNAVMGGENSIQKWENSPLRYGDYLHFSPEAYRMFGLAFGEALLETQR